MKKREEFEKKCAKLIENGQESLIESDVYQYSGYLVVIDDAIAIVCEDYNYVNLLPEFIKTASDFQLLIRLLNSTHRSGVLAGKESIKSEFRKLIQPIE